MAAVLPGAVCWELALSRRDTYHTSCLPSSKAVILYCLHCECLKTFTVGNILLDSYKSLSTDWRVDIKKKKSDNLPGVTIFSSPCFNHNDIKFYILNKSILELMKLWVKFAKCQAHIMLLRLDEKKRLDKIHISVRNVLTVKFTQMFIFDSQPFFFKYIHLYRHHMIRPSLHTHLWTMDTETYKYLKNETFSKWNENIKPFFYAPSFGKNISRGSSFDWISQEESTMSASPSSLTRWSRVPAVLPKSNFDMLEHIWHSFPFRGWENSRKN